MPKTYRDIRFESILVLTLGNNDYTPLNAPTYNDLCGRDIMFCGDPIYYRVLKENSRTTLISLSSKNKLEKDNNIPNGE